MTRNRRFHRRLALALTAMMAAVSIGCGDSTTPSTTTKPEAVSAPPPPGRTEKAKGKMQMPHL
jgi:hypothetical protein